jgi:hypothetical protein
MDGGRRDRVESVERAMEVRKDEDGRRDLEKDRGGKTAGRIGGKEGCVKGAM